MVECRKSPKIRHFFTAYGAIRDINTTVSTRFFFSNEIPCSFATPFGIAKLNSMLFIVLPSILSLGFKFTLLIKLLSKAFCYTFIWFSLHKQISTPSFMERMAKPFHLGITIAELRLLCLFPSFCFKKSVWLVLRLTVYSSSFYLFVNSL